MENKKKFRKFSWEYTVRNWGKYSFPFRPSDGDIEIYKSVLGEFKNKKNILLLGSTPEIREIFSGLKLKIMVTDSSFEMMEGMVSFGNINTIKEKWIKSDWIDLNKFFKNNYFDLIFGDLVLRNIESDQQNNFLKIIVGLLKEDGIFVNRVHCYDEKMSKLSLKEIVEKVLSFKNISQKTKEDLITSRLFDKYTDKKNKVVDKQTFSKWIKKEEEEIVKNIYKKWGGGKRTWIQRTEKEILKMFKKYFNIEDKKIARDYIDSQFYPIYFLKKNS